MRSQSSYLCSWSCLPARVHRHDRHLQEGALTRFPGALRVRGALARHRRTLAWLRCCRGWRPAPRCRPSKPRCTGRGRSVEPRATPFFAQEDHQCGPAALATVLASSGRCRPELPSWSPSRTAGREEPAGPSSRRGEGRRGRFLRTAADPGALGRGTGAAGPSWYCRTWHRCVSRWHYAVLVGLDAGTRRGDPAIGARHARTSCPGRVSTDSWKARRPMAVVVLEPGAFSGESRAAAFPRGDPGTSSGPGSSTRPPPRTPRPRCDRGKRWCISRSQTTPICGVTCGGGRVLRAALPSRLMTLRCATTWPRPARRRLVAAGRGRGADRRGAGPVARRLEGDAQRDIGRSQPPVQRNGTAPTGPASSGWRQRPGANRYHRR